MMKEIFFDWLEHFRVLVPGGVSPTNRHLLIFDDHGSHVALSIIQEARRLGIDLLTLPSHTSHVIQPLDVSVFEPFKAYSKSKWAEFVTRFPNIDIIREKLVELGNKAMIRAMNPSNIKFGFKRTGIWPLNSNALVGDMRPSETYKIDDIEDAFAV